MQVIPETCSVYIKLDIYSCKLSQNFKRKKEEDVKRNLLNNPMKMKRLKKQVHKLVYRKH